MNHHRVLFPLTLMASGLVVCLGLGQPEDRGGRPPGPRGGDPSQFVERMLENDSNEDGRLSRDELPGRFADRLFEQADTDEDGFLTEAELTAYAEGRGAGRGPSEGGPQGESATVEDHMQQAGRALRGLRRSSLDEESRVADLERVGRIQASLVFAKSRINSIHMAPQAEARYGEDKDTYALDVRMQLIAAIRASLDLEEAIARGGGDEARAALDRLIEAQEAGHTAFRHEEEHDEEGEGEGPQRGNRPPDRP